MNLTCYIVDDEPHAIAILKDFIEKTPGLQISGYAENPLIALDKINREQPALTFLDVDMPELNGLQFASIVKSQTAVIFTTAYREYAVEAFETEAADYLLKPISYERFLGCIQKIRKSMAAFQKPPEIHPTSFFVKSGTKDKLLRVEIEDIIFISGFDHYVEIHFKEQKLVTYLKLSEIWERLPEDKFSRIHRSYIVNHHAILSIEPGQVKVASDVCIPIGNTYKDAFRKKLSGSSFIF